MDSAILSLLGAFLLSIIGLFAFIWSLRKGLLVENPAAASVIFARGEVGKIDDPALSGDEQHKMQAAVHSGAMLAVDATEIADRVDADRSSAFPVFMFIAFACFWLLIGSFAGLISSFKLHEPDWLVQQAWLSFGRIRSVHLNAVIYGWSSNAALAVILWVLPRLLRTRLHGAIWAMIGGTFINAGIVAGVGAIAAGWTDGMEYLEIPWQIDIFIFAGFALIILSALYTQSTGRTHGRSAGHDQLVVRAQCARAVVHPRICGCDLLLSTEDHRTTGGVIQLVAAGLLDTCVFLRTGRWPSPDRRTDTRLVDDVIDRAKCDDDHPGNRLHDQHEGNAQGTDAFGALFADAAIHDVWRIDVFGVVRSRIL